MRRLPVCRNTYAVACSCDKRSSRSSATWLPRRRAALAPPVSLYISETQELEYALSKIANDADWYAGAGYTYLVSPWSGRAYCSACDHRRTRRSRRRETWTFWRFVGIGPLEKWKLTIVNVVRYTCFLHYYFEKTAHDMCPLLELNN